MEYSDEFPDFGGYADEYGTNEQALPADHWSHDNDWVQFVDGMVQALQEGPQALEAWYAEMAKANGLRELAEAEAALEEVSGAFGSRERQEAILEAMKKMNRGS